MEKSQFDGSITGANKHYIEVTRLSQHIELFFLVHAHSIHTLTHLYHGVNQINTHMVSPCARVHVNEPFVPHLQSVELDCYRPTSCLAVVNLLYIAKYCVFQRWRNSWLKQCPIAMKLSASDVLFNYLFSVPKLVQF